MRSSGLCSESSDDDELESSLPWRSSPRMLFQSSGRAGGFSAEKKADSEVQELVASLRDEALAKFRTEMPDWKGNWTEFTAVTYCTQVVAGTNFSVKMKVSDTMHVSVSIFRPLPHTGQPPTVTDVRLSA